MLLMSIIVRLCDIIVSYIQQKGGLVIPKGYEKMRDAIKEDLIKKGMSREKADKEAKKIAAATWNKKHPKSPVTNKSHKKRR